MCIAVAYAITEYAEKKGLSEKSIIPNMGETEMYIREAAKVEIKAIEL